MPPDNQSAGATPAAGDATSPQTPAQPAAGQASTTPQQPATGGDDGLGDAGKRALSEERAAKKAAEKERDQLQTRLEELENANRSDTERAIAAARKEAAAEVESRYQVRIRAADVRAGLTAAGAIDPEIGALASEFAELKVSDVGTEGLAAAVEAFKIAHPSQFAPTTPQGSADGGVRGNGAGTSDMNALLRRSTGRT